MLSRKRDALPPWLSTTINHVTRQENTLLPGTPDTGTGLSPRHGRGAAAALGHGRFPCGSVGSEVPGPKSHLSTATTRTVQGIHYHAPMAYLFPKSLGSTWLFLPSPEPQGPKGTGCKIFPVQTRKRQEGQSPTEVCVGGWRQGSRRLLRPAGSLILPHLRPRKRTRL